jgi:hypothetical protein
VLSWRIRWLSRSFPAWSCGIWWPESSTWVDKVSKTMKFFLRALDRKVFFFTN